MKSHYINIKKNFKIRIKKDENFIQLNNTKETNSLILSKKSPVKELSLKKKLKNYIHGEQVGWYLELNFKGLGYKIFKYKDYIALDVGYSNIILFKPKKNVKIKIIKTRFLLFTADKQYLYNIAAYLKSYIKVNNYKGKGIFLKNEIIKIKEVKL